MRDIAMQVGVSRTTVSFVLNGKHSSVGINEETRQRVLRAAAELGYRRNELARAVITGKNPVFAFLILAPMLQSDVAARVLGGLLDEAEARQYAIQVIRLNGTEDGEILQRCVELRPTGVVGLYITPESLDDVRREMSRFHIPMVMLDSVPQLQGAARILSDDVAGCRLAIQHLTELGHQRIAFIAGTPWSVAGNLREQGYRLAMAEAGLGIPAGYVKVGRWDPQRIVQVTRELFETEPVPPTAVFCADDKTAMIACATIRQVGRRVPDDVSVVGFADLAMAEYNDPPLTTIAQPFSEMGRAAIRRLIAVSEEGDHTFDDVDAAADAAVPLADELLPTRLVVRRSTARPTG